MCTGMCTMFGGVVGMATTRRAVSAPAMCGEANSAAANAMGAMRANFMPLILPAFGPLDFGPEIFASPLELRHVATE